MEKVSSGSYIAILDQNLQQVCFYMFAYSVQEWLIVLQKSLMHFLM